MTTGISEVARLAAATAGVPAVTMASTFSRTNSEAKSGKSFLSAFRPAKLKADVLTFDKTAFTQSLLKVFP